VLGEVAMAALAVWAALVGPVVRVALAQAALAGR
jgi:hypothetical protein